MLIFKRANIQYYFQILFNFAVLNVYCFFRLSIIKIKNYTMKYSQLTKEQFEELHEEFAIFLAAQSIDAKEWEIIKKEKQDLADKELNAFSDFVWEKVLNKANYIEHFSKDTLNLFKCNEEGMQRIVVKIKNNEIDLLDENGFNWFLDNSKDDSIEYLKGDKKYQKEKNLEIFDLIQQGGVVGDGKLFDAIYKVIS